MKIKFYNVGNTSFLEAFFDDDDLIESKRLEGAGTIIRNRCPLVYFDRTFNDIHPDVLGVICLAIFYPFIGKKVEFPLPVSSRLVNSINREIFTKTKKIEVVNINDELAKYSGDGRSVTAFGGGFDSSAIRAVFPDTYLVHEASIKNGVKVVDKTCDLINKLNKQYKGEVITTNSRFISEPGGWHVWLGSIVTSALVASSIGASYIFSGTILGSAFLSNGRKYFDRHSSSKWHGPSGNYWQQLFEDIGLPLVSPLMGCSEILTMEASLKKLPKDEIFFCTQNNGTECGRCSKCFRRYAIANYLGLNDGDFSPFNNSEVLGLLETKPIYFGHIYAAMLSDGWTPPTWIKERLKLLPQSITFPLKYYPGSLEFMPDELKEDVKKRLDHEFSSMNEEEVNDMKAWNMLD